MIRTVEFVTFTWIFFIGLFNSCNFHFFASASAEVDAVENVEAKVKVKAGDSFSANENETTSVVLNKCDPDSFNSASEVKHFTSIFGIYGTAEVFNFSFISDFNRGKKHPCEIETVKIQFSNSNSNSSSASIPENENIIIVEPEFWTYGLFSYQEKFVLNPENYCIKSMSENVLTVEICRQNASTSNPDSDSNSNSNSAGPKSNSYLYSYFPPTLQKCCYMENTLIVGEDQKSIACKYSVNPPWKPKSMEKNEIHPNYKVSGLPCDKMQFILPHQLESKIKRTKKSAIHFQNVRVMENGTVETRESESHNWTMLEQNTYCVDGFYHADLTNNKSRAEGYEPYSKIPAENFMVLYCPPDQSESEYAKIKDTIVTVGVFISTFVLALIVIVFGLVWNQQNIHGWTKAAFSLALLFWFLFTGVRHVYTDDDGFCVFVAVATHFFRIAAFSWMLLLNFDLWSTISSMTAANQRSKERKRLLCYCCVALGIPTLVVSISLIIESQFSPSDDGVIRPQYGRTRCYLDHSAVKVYSMYPSLILFLPNFLFIFLTIKIIMDLKKGREKLRGKNSKITDDQKNNNAEMILCVKLFFIMGISWIFDIISGLTDTDEVSWGWLVLDIYNICQPFLLFVLFICNKTIREQLADKYSLFKAGFKWIDVHLPCLSVGGGNEQNDSQATKSSAFTTPEEKSMNFSTFSSTANNN